VQKADLGVSFNKENGGTGPEAFPKEIQIPRRDKHCTDISLVLFQIPSKISFTPSDFVISMTFLVISTDEKSE